MRILDFLGTFGTHCCSSVRGITVSLGGTADQVLMEVGWQSGAEISGV